VTDRDGDQVEVVANTFAELRKKIARRKGISVEDIMAIKKRNNSSVKEDDDLDALDDKEEIVVVEKQCCGHLCREGEREGELKQNESPTIPKWLTFLSVMYTASTEQNL
jgi:hypothetical protein